MGDSEYTASVDAVLSHPDLDMEDWDVISDYCLPEPNYVDPHGAAVPLSDALTRIGVENGPLSGVKNEVDRLLLLSYLIENGTDVRGA